MGQAFFALYFLKKVPLKLNLRGYMKANNLKVLFTFLLMGTIQANVPWSVIEKNYKKERGNLKALSHLKCFYNNFSHKNISLDNENKNAPYSRCKNLDPVRLDDQRYFSVIDYNSPSSKRRMFLVDTESGRVKSMGVAHGRYRSGYFRMFTRPFKNSVRWAKYFSNKPGSRASSTGFFLAGQEYHGKFGRSLVLHGLEPDINDNACRRAVVIHKHFLVTKRRAYVMSSGCPMVSRSNINPVINALKGKQNGMLLEEAGGLVFIYGKREKNWSYGDCPIELN